MGNLSSSLAFEDIEEQHEEAALKLLVKTRHLSISNIESEIQSLCQLATVKVKGRITVSF